VVQGVGPEFKPQYGKKKKKKKKRKKSLFWLMVLDQGWWGHI
jgi:hypothetical protein